MEIPQIYGKMSIGVKRQTKNFTNGILGESVFKSNTNVQSMGLISYFKMKGVLATPALNVERMLIPMAEDSGARFVDLKPIETLPVP